MRDRAYARWRGCSLRRLQQLKAEGVVVFEAGLIDVAATDAKIAASRQTRIQHMRNGEKRRNDGGAGEVGGGDDARLSYTRAQIQSTLALARQRRIKADRQEGRLVETEQVARVVTGALKAVSQAMLRLPDRMAMELWQERDEHRFRQRLDEEVREVLGELARRLGELGYEPDRNDAGGDG